MVFKTSLDKTAFIITIAVSVLFAIIIGVQFFLFRDGNHVIHLYSSLICLIIFFTAFAFRPLKYLITTKELIIERPARNIHIKKADIE